MSTQFLNKVLDFVNICDKDISLKAGVYNSKIKKINDNIINKLKNMSDNEMLKVVYTRAAPYSDESCFPNHFVFNLENGRSNSTVFSDIGREELERQATIPGTNSDKLVKSFHIMEVLGMPANMKNTEKITLRGCIENFINSIKFIYNNVSSVTCEIGDDDEEEETDSSSHSDMNLDNFLWLFSTSSLGEEESAARRRMREYLIKNLNEYARKYLESEYCPYSNIVKIIKEEQDENILYEKVKNEILNSISIQIYVNPIKVLDAVNAFIGLMQSVGKKVTSLNRPEISTYNCCSTEGFIPLASLFKNGLKSDMLWIETFSGNILSKSISQGIIQREGINSLSSAIRKGSSQINVENIMYGFMGRCFTNEKNILEEHTLRTLGIADTNIPFYTDKFLKCNENKKFYQNFLGNGFTDGSFLEDKILMNMLLMFETGVSIVWNNTINFPASKVFLKLGDLGYFSRIQPNFIVSYVDVGSQNNINTYVFNEKCKKPVCFHIGATHADGKIDVKDSLFRLTENRLLINFSELRCGTIRLLCRKSNFLTYTPDTFEATDILSSLEESTRKSMDMYALTPFILKSRTEHYDGFSERLLILRYLVFNYLSSLLSPIIYYIIEDINKDHKKISEINNIYNGLIDEICEIIKEKGEAEANIKFVNDYIKWRFGAKYCDAVNADNTIPSRLAAIMAKTVFDVY